VKLQGVHDSRVYATDGFDLLWSADGDRFERVGRLPAPIDGVDGLATRALTDRPWRRLTATLVGAVPAVNVWPLSGDSLLATVGRRLLASDGGQTWTETRRLPTSSGPMGVLPTAVSHHGGTTYLGEYPLSPERAPRVLRSSDHGRTWETAVSLPEVRHVHAVQRDPFTDDVWVTTGDSDSASRIGRLREGRLEVVGGGSQAWRAVQLAFTESSVLWGMDCAYADRNRIFRLPRAEVGVADPAIEPVHEVPGSVFYAATLSTAEETWIVFSTAMEVGRDSTGPADQTASAARGVVVATSTASGCTDWRELAAYRRRRCLGDRLPGLPRANGYVFLAADPDLGFLYNPCNTRADNGRIRRITPETLRRTPTVA
jgi:hypothetical protein